MVYSIPSLPPAGSFQPSLSDRRRVAAEEHTLPHAGAHRGRAMNDRRFQSRQWRLCLRATTPCKSSDQCRDTPASSLPPQAILLLFLAPGGQLRKLAQASSKARDQKYTLADWLARVGQLMSTSSVLLTDLAVTSTIEIGVRRAAMGQQKLSPRNFPAELNPCSKFPDPLRKIPCSVV